MLNRSRVYEKAPPKLTAKQIYIFCEGDKRETVYFYFFNRLATQVILQTVEIKDGKNSPRGLYQNARKTFFGIPDEEVMPEYNLLPGDEVWFVVDTDAWGEQIPELRECVSNHENWAVVQSNPCFEVWLYHHFYEQKPAEEVSNWKAFLNRALPGGFDSRKHPCHVLQATAAAKANFTATNGLPDLVTTEVFRLTESFLPFIAEKLKSLVP